MSKPQKSKLDPHAQTLVSMELEGKTLPEMIAWLKGEGVTCAASTLSDYLSASRSARREAALLAQITTGARQSKEVESAFAKNPAPELETLIKLLRVLIMQLSTGGVDNPEMLKLGDQLTNTVVHFLSAQTKAAHKERELSLAENKYMRETCKLFVAWAADKRAGEITNSPASNADKIERLGQLMFGEDCKS
jgi:hypothetical protein